MKSNSKKEQDVTDESLNVAKAGEGEKTLPSPALYNRNQGVSMSFWVSGVFTTMLGLSFQPAFILATVFLILSLLIQFDLWEMKR